MAITEFTAALNQVASERNIKPEEVISTLKEALVAAYKKDNPDFVIDEDASEEDIAANDDRLAADIDPDTGSVKILLEGKDVTPAGFGRIASQTAKQVILQKIREAEKRSIADEYKDLIGTITQGYIFRIDRDTVIMDIGKTHGVLPVSEQIPRERYLVNQKYKILIKDVTSDEESSSSTIILSRRDSEFINKLFSQEVPEITKGIVSIESIAREAGERTKIAVSSTDTKIDPSGACIGQKGVRVQAVTDELNGEKIDIINFSSSPDRFIAAALAPAHVIDVILDHEEKAALVKVAEDQLSLAIGNKGQNARLAAKLTGWRISIDGSDVEVDPETTAEDMEDTEISAKKPKEKVEKEVETEATPEAEEKVEEETEAKEEVKTEEKVETKAKTKTKTKAKAKTKTKTKKEETPEGEDNKKDEDDK